MRVAYFDFGDDLWGTSRHASVMEAHVWSTISSTWIKWSALVLSDCWSIVDQLRRSLVLTCWLLWLTCWYVGQCCCLAVKRVSFDAEFCWHGLPFRVFPFHWATAKFLWVQNSFGIQNEISQRVAISIAKFLWVQDWFAHCGVSTEWSITRPCSPEMMHPHAFGYPNPGTTTLDVCVYF